ncbi:MAG: penicillin-binding protein 1A [Campylobacterales bacterium]
MQRFLRWLGLAILSGAVLVALLAAFYLVRALSIDTDPLIYYNPPQTTQFYDRNGELVANLFADEHRLYVPFDKIPSRLVEALVAIEDTSFFEHDGLNFEAIFRAAYRVAMAGRAVEGASTVTQQLVKNLLLTRDKTIDRKLKEAILSLRIEMQLGKEQILERYFNAIYFGHGYYGIRTAALGYFRKNLDELTLKEMAMLAGLPRAPSFYDPTKHFKMSLTRGNLVLDRMFHLGWISEAEYREGLLEIPVVYDDTLTRNRAPYAIDAIVSQLSADFPDLKNGGYIVKTTLDMSVQATAETALKQGYQTNRDRVEKFYRDETARYNRLKADHNASDPKQAEDLAKLEKSLQGLLTVTENNETNATTIVYALNEPVFAAKLEQLNGAMITLDQQTGDLLALVGGVDYTKSVFNRAVQSRRQLGSSFKPFIYLAAFDLGYSPASPIADISRTYKFTTEDEEEKVWRPTNYEDNFLGLMTARDAVVNSRNLATINLIGSVGIQVLFDKLTAYSHIQLPYDMAIALGAHSMTLLEFSEYLSIISNYGGRVKPRVATQVIDRFGHSRYYESVTEQVTPPEQAYLMIDVLKDAVNRGTGRRARVNGIDVAGKTGTTNDYRDAWFMGFTPTTQTIVWFGNDDNTPVSGHATGGGFAAPVFASYYKELLKIRPELKRRFDKPEGVREINIGGGRKEIFTDISKPPRDLTSPAAPQGGEILF